MKPLFWFKVIKGVWFTVLVSGALLCLFTFFSLKMDDPSAFSGLYANVALLVGSFVGGNMAARGEDSGLLSALVCGVICMIIILLPSLMFSSWGADSLLRAVLTVLSSVVGAFIFGRRESRVSGRKSAKKRREIARRYGG